jgi:hypothetical protein
MEDREQSPCTDGDSDLRYTGQKSEGIHEKNFSLRQNNEDIHFSM